MIFQDLFHICRILEIPLLLEIPEALQPRAIELLENPPDIVKLVDPADTLGRRARAPRRHLIAPDSGPGSRRHGCCVLSMTG